MSGLIRFLIIAVTLCSCSGEYHLRKAYQKGALEQSVVDTMVVIDTVFTIDTAFIYEVSPDSVTYIDTVYCDSNNLPQLKGAVRTSGRLSVDVSIKDGVLVANARTEALRDSINVLIEKNVQLEKRIEYNKVSSKLTAQMKRDNDIREEEAKASKLWAFVAMVALAFAILIYFVNKFT